jgi:hypothetical protein
LNAYGVATNANVPIAARLTPTVASHAESVEKVSRNGKPLAKPSGKISKTRQSRYTVSECRQFVIAPSQSGTSPV